MVREIQLSNSHLTTTVDDEDFDSLSQFTWQLHQGSKRGSYSHHCVRGHVNGRRVYLHRLVMGEPEGLDVDHWNGDALDNRRANLRVATRSQNIVNFQSRRPNRTGYRGVTKWKNAWRARVCRDGVIYPLGSFSSPEAAARAYDAKALELYGSFARINFPNTNDQSA